MSGAGQDVVSGAFGGLMMTLSGHPLDTFKVRLQTQSASNPKYSGLADVARKTVAEEGLAGLYRGVASPLVGQMAFNAVQFAVNSAAVTYLRGDRPPGSRLSLPEYFAAGAVTGVAVAMVEAPQDLFKSQLQVQVFRERPEFTTVSQCVRRVWAEGGVRGVYQGLGATMARNAMGVSLYFGGYEGTRSWMVGPGGSVSELGAWATLGAGSVAGVMYWGIAYPLDIIKSTVQADAIARSARRYSSVAAVARGLYAEGGLRRFYRGYSACMLRAIPANAACFYGYEAFKKYVFGGGT